jgi:predicted TIM-barrel fold metal-dependent hydrolase
MTVHDADNRKSVLVDCDIHVGYDALSDVHPYLSATTRELLQESATFGFQMPSYPWQHPTGWIRKDTYGGKTAAGALTPGFTLGQLREQLLDRYGVDRGIAIPDEPAGYSILPNANLAAELCSAYNSWLADHWLSHEPRLAGTIVVPGQHPAAAAREIRRWAGDDRFVGVFLPGAARVPYGNPLYDPIWDAANETRLPVVVHVHYEGVGISNPLTGAGHPDFYMEYHALVGSSLAGHLASVLCHGIFERFPNTRLMLMEGGLGLYAGLLWRLDTNWKACRSETPHCLRPPSEYVWDHVRFTTQPLEAPPEPAQLRGVLEPLRPQQTLCFASDYPHWDFDEPRLTLRDMPSAWHPGILGHNAADFYGLGVAATAVA